jgi:hypothetical protein
VYVCMCVCVRVCVCVRAFWGGGEGGDWLHVYVCVQV